MTGSNRRSALKRVAGHAFIAAAIVAVSVRAQQDVPANPLEKPGWAVTLHDEFDGPTLDTVNTWVPMLWGDPKRHAKWQFLSDHNASVIRIYNGEKTGTSSYSPVALETSNEKNDGSNIDHLKQFYGYYEHRGRNPKSATGTNPSGGQVNNNAWWLVLNTSGWWELDIFETGWGPGLTFHWGGQGQTTGRHQWTVYNRQIQSPENYYTVQAFEMYEYGIRCWNNGQLDCDIGMDWSKAPVQSGLVHILSVGDCLGAEMFIDYWRAYHKDAATAPAAPVYNAVGHPSTTQAALSWNTALRATKYEVYVHTDEIPCPQGLKGSPTQPSLAVTGLSQNTKYYWTVASVNQYGVRTFGPISSFNSSDRPTRAATRLSAAAAHTATPLMLFDTRGRRLARISGANLERGAGSKAGVVIAVPMTGKRGATAMMARMIDR